MVEGKDLNDIGDRVKWITSKRDLDYNKELSAIVQQVARNLREILDNANDRDKSLTFAIGAFEHLTNLIAEICKEIGRRDPK